GGRVRPRGAPACLPLSTAPSPLPADARSALLGEMKILDGRNVLVSGATSGIGRACAARLHQDGARVLLVGRRQERLEELAAELGERCATHVVDVRNPAAVEELAGRDLAIDVLVNAAGLALGLDPVHLASLEDWDTMIDTNCKALVHMTRAFVPG